MFALVGPDPATCFDSGKSIPGLLLLLLFFLLELALGLVLLEDTLSLKVLI